MIVSPRRISAIGTSGAVAMQEKGSSRPVFCIRSEPILPGVRDQPPVQGASSALNLFYKNTLDGFSLLK
jgi:hypothetical protein